MKRPRNTDMPQRLGRRDLLLAAGAGLGALAVGGFGPTSARGLALPSYADGTLTGRVTDILTDQPISGASVRVAPSGPSTTTDLAGEYQLTVQPGTYALTAEAVGYEPLTFTTCQVVGGIASVVRFPLAKPFRTQQEEEAIYDKLIVQRESPLPSSGPSLVAPTGLGAQAITLPSTITVRSEIDPNNEWTVPLEDYVKGVVPNEVPASWPSEAVKAQAVAARSYGVVSYLAKGYVWDYTQDQVYIPSNRTPASDAAVDATRGVVVTWSGSIAQTFFYSRCNDITTRDSERAISSTRCIVLGWNYVAYCRARSCGGHGPYQYSTCSGDLYGYNGHGVGMCQWGAWARANEGLAHQDILRRYYSGIDFYTGGAPTPTPTPSPTPTPTPPATPVQTSPGNGALLLPGETFTLAWRSPRAVRYLVTLNGSLQYDVVGVDAGSLTMVAGAVRPDPYYWQVTAFDSFGRSTSGPTWYYRVVSQRLETYLPSVYR